MNTKAFYEAQADTRETGADIDGRVKKVAKLFQKHLGTAQRLLDIGCGVGSITLHLKVLLQAQEACGVEISEKRVKAACERGINVVLADLNRGSLPFKNGSFDAIFCGEIIEHLVDPDHLLDEVGRTLAPGGVCVLTTPNLATWYNRFALLMGWQPFDTSVSFRHEVGRPKFLVSDYGCRDHLRVFTLKALKELLKLHNFRILEVKGTALGEAIPGVKDPSSSPLRAFLHRLVSPLDVMLSLSPSLATRVVVAFKKASEDEGLRR